MHADYYCRECTKYLHIISKMSNPAENSITIYEALQHIKNGKYVMPAFQRQFVWSMEQIAAFL